MERFIVTDKGVEKFDFHDTKSELVYDDVVDRSNFRPDSENVRSYMQNPTSSGKGQYDDPDNPPTLVEIKMRSGKLDKAEVSQLMLKEKNKLSELQETKAKKAQAEKMQKLNDARQAYLDQRVGFNGNDAEN